MKTVTVLDSLIDLKQAMEKDRFLIVHYDETQLRLMGTNRDKYRLEGFENLSKVDLIYELLSFAGFRIIKGDF